MSVPNPVATHQVVGTSFGFFTPDEIRRLSVKLIDNPVSLSRLLTPIEGALYDPAMGPIDRDAKCVTCGLMDLHCPGHFGHIELPVPVYNPLVFAELLTVMKLICFNCHHFRMDMKRTKKIVKILHLINSGNLEAVLAEADTLNDKGKMRKGASGDFEEAGAESIYDGTEITEEDMLRLKISCNMADFRNKIIHKFTHEQPTLVCDNCQAPRLPIGREGHAKIFMKRHGPVKMRSIWAKGARYYSVLHKGRTDETDAEQLLGTVQSTTSASEIPASLPPGSAFLDTGAEYDPVMRWLFYKDEENTAAYRKLVSDEESLKKPTAKKSGGKKSAATSLLDDSEMELEQEQQPPKEMNDRTLAAATAKTSPASQRIMFPNEVQRHMELLWKAESDIVPMIWSSLFKGPNGVKLRRTDSAIFFMTVLPVPPNRFRPIGAVNGIKSEHIQNTILTRVLQAIRDLYEIVNPTTSTAKKLTPAQLKAKAENIYVKDKSELWLSIQAAVNDLVDNTLTNKLRTGPARPPGIKQIIEKKQGLFRQNMMGKRVDFAARSVISPDPYIATTEIGVPLYFAKGLNYPEPVTDYNVDMLRQMVLNGPDVHPGANAVEDELGNVIPLRGDRSSRTGIANTLQKPSLSSLGGGNLHGVKKVYRHLIDGDALIVNRQPTLHKPSMMVHKARILGNENTIQMHYCNCNTYNADFDGDEMNLHLVQNEVAKAEAHTIAINDNQYIVPKDGAPIRGLIQDHILSGVLLTQRDTFLTKEHFQQLLYYCVWDLHPKSPMVTMPPPAILKPQPLWTGKQVVTAMLDNLLHGEEPLNLTSKCTVPEEMWGKGSNEGVLIIRGNQLLSGSLGKNQFGAKPHGLVHAVYELYGPSFSASLLTVLGRLLTHWLQFTGFTCGMDDTLLHKKTEEERAAIRVTSDRCGLRQAGIFLGMYTPESADDDEPVSEEDKEFIMDKLKQASESAEEWDKWDKHMIGNASRTTSKIIDTCLPKGQIKPFPKNNLGLMTVSGAKGSRVNFSQISCLLGQQELEGKRVPLMVTGRSLPSFLPFDPSPRAGGYVADRFLTGVRPQEYFFHCMAGREGLIDTAVKTSRSGYLQRCIIKHLEALVVQYDHTVRDVSDGSVLQFRYGEDSIDVMKVGFMTKFDFFADNLEAVLQAYDFAQANEKLKRVSTKAVKKIHNGLKESIAQKEQSKKNLEADAKRTGLGIEQLAPYRNPPVEVPDPLISTYWPGSTLGCVSEKYDDALEDFIKSNPQLFTDTKEASRGRKLINPDIFRNAMHLKYLRCLTEAGEVVGVLAGQSIGEPSTQMTLNTFHLAGKGEVNVTLGIPRLKELVQTAGSIKTPSMTLPLHPQCTLKDAERLANRLYRLSMAELIERIAVVETLKSSGGNNSRNYDIEIELKPFEPRWEITWAKLRTKTTGFVASLLNEIAKFFKMKRFFAGKDTLGFNWDALGDVIDGTDEDDRAPRAAKKEETDANDEPEEREDTNKKEDDDVSSDNSDSDEDSDSDDDEEPKSDSESEGSDDEAAADGDPEIDAGNALVDALVGSDSEDTPKPKKVKKSSKVVVEKIKGPAVNVPSHREAENANAKSLSFLMGQSGYLTKYAFSEETGKFSFSLSIPADKPKLLLVSVLEREAEKFVIRQVAGIIKAAVLKADKTNPTIRVQTAGINFAHIHRLTRVVDVDNISTNDVQAVYRTYGVEAAREALRAEISAVFKAYGITVDPRHLTLVADYMTHTGEIRAMTRTGIATSASPFLKMSFESTTRFLATSALRGDFENMLGPSAAIVLGLTPKLGTGICELKHDFNFNGEVQEKAEAY